MPAKPTKPANGGDRPGCAFCRNEVDHKALGAKLRAGREAAGLVQADVARMMKISATFLCDLEQGKRNWTPKLQERYLSAIKNQA